VNCNVKWNDYLQSVQLNRAMIQLQKKTL